jgi:hypothetical protein
MPNILQRWLLGAAALLFALPASAQFVSFDFCGYVKESSPMAQQGTPVFGRFSWDLSAVGYTPFPGAGYYTSPETGSFTFSVGKHHVKAETTQVVINNDVATSDLIDINGHAPVVNGTLFRDGYVSIRLMSAPGNMTALQDSRLPRELDVAAFDSVQHNVFQLYSGAVNDDRMLDVTLNWILRADVNPGRSDRRQCSRP